MPWASTGRLGVVPVLGSAGSDRGLAVGRAGSGSRFGEPGRTRIGGRRWSPVRGWGPWLTPPVGRRCRPLQFCPFGRIRSWRTRRLLIAPPVPSESAGPMPIRCRTGLIRPGADRSEVGDRFSAAATDGAVSPLTVISGPACPVCSGRGRRGRHPTVAGCCATAPNGHDERGAPRSCRHSVEEFGIGEESTRPARFAVAGRRLEYGPR